MGMARYYPPVAMGELMANWAAPQHVLMALGYYALILLAAPALLRGWLGARLVAAGQMAFTNYIATSVVLAALFMAGGGAVWPDRSCRANGHRAVGLGRDAGFERALAGAFSPRSAGMAVAIAGRAPGITL
jgi:hypothetical protein